MEIARANQFPVINIDLMTGCVDETPETWERSLETLIGLAPEHVSIYRMEIYKNTLMYAAGYTGPGVGGVPTDEEEQVLWFRAVERLEAAGYTQVKGHAFVKRPEHIHTHRVDAWSGGDVLGMGVGSYSYLNDCVFQNSSSWDDYVAKASAGVSPVERRLRLNTQQVMTREIILGLKLFRVDRIAFRQRHGFDAVELNRAQVDALVADGLLEVTDEAIILTRKGYAYVDVICSRFYLPEHVPQAFVRFATEAELTQAAVLGATPGWPIDPASVPNGRDAALSVLQG
jgi:oxygen-independent coproporphyrinogen-3 oxidase